MKKIIALVFVVSLIIGIKSNHGKNDWVQIDFTNENGVKGVEEGPAVNATPTLPEIKISYPERKAQAIQLAEDAAREFGMDSETLLCVLNQESGVESHDPKTGELKCGDNGASCGIGQIKLPTWKSIRTNAGWETDDKRWNDFENIRTTAYGITHGWQEHWTGFRTCRDWGYKIK